MESENSMPVTTAAADPVPLGYGALGVTMLLLSGLNSGLVKTGGLAFIGMGLSFGGVALLVAGILEYRRGQTFHATAFVSFAAFWLGLSIMIAFDRLGRPLGGSLFVGDGFIWFFFSWAIYSSLLLVGALRTSVASIAVFLLLALQFWCLWIGSLQGINGNAGHGFTAAGGYVGIATTIAAFYVCLAGLVNAAFERVVLPIMSMATTADAQRPRNTQL